MTHQEIKLGDEVRYRVGPSTEAVTGLVIAVETYISLAATTEYVYVRWVTHAGNPDKEPTRHDAKELISLRSAVGAPEHPQ